jgi:hypothetical protein
MNQAIYVGYIYINNLFKLLSYVYFSLGVLDKNVILILKKLIKTRHMLVNAWNFSSFAKIFTKIHA